MILPTLVTASNRIPAAGDIAGPPVLTRGSGTIVAGLYRGPTAHQILSGSLAAQKPPAAIPGTVHHYTDAGIGDRIIVGGYGAFRSA